MPIPRYERELQQVASPRFKRAFFGILCLGVIVGVVIGIGWILTVLANP